MIKTNVLIPHQPNGDHRRLHSAVADALFTEPAGCTITDEILNLAADAHSQFGSAVDKFLPELKQAGILELTKRNVIGFCSTGPCLKGANEPFQAAAHGGILNAQMCGDLIEKIGRRARPRDRLLTAF